MTNHEPKHPPADVLLPCPFCGGEAGVGTQYDPDGPFAFVNCTDCMASTNTLLGQQYAFTEAEAIAAWNNRKHPPADMAGLDDLIWRIKERMPIDHTEMLALAARVKVLEAEVAHYQRLLKGRDKFIVDNDLFMQFVDTLKGTEQ